MEPFEMDKIIREKLQGKPDVYRQEIEETRPFVWSAVHNRINEKRSPTWIHLAAAVLLLFISFTFVIIKINQRHKAEINALAEIVDFLQKDHQLEKEVLQAKAAQVSLLINQLKVSESRLAEAVQTNPAGQRDHVIHRTDTVYIRQVEYITTSTQLPNEQDPVAGVAEIEPQLAVTQVPENKKDDIIFPAERIQSGSQDSETIKLRFGALTARKN